MGLFNRKRKKEPEIIPIITPTHTHVFKDLPWYMETEYNGSLRTAGYKIIEEYICITCGEVKKKVLEEEHWSNITSQEREEAYRDIRKRYKEYLRPKAVVKDMINDIQLVQDAEKLQLIEKLHSIPHPNVGNAKQNIPMKTDKAPKIELPNNNYGELIDV